MSRYTVLAWSVAVSASIAAGQSFTITTTSLPTAIFEQPYAPVLLETANDPGPVAWSITGAPSGFVAGPAPSNQPQADGTFCYGFVTQSGPPLCTGTVQSVPGVYSVTVQARSLSTNQTATQVYTFAVVQPLKINTTTLPDAAANQPYAYQIQASGGTGQFAWSISAGALPGGITLDPMAGTLSGTAPNVTAIFTFTVLITDQVTQATISRQFTINVIGGIAITTTALPDATVNQPYSFQLAATGATGLVWSIPAGSQLPPSFSLSSTGLLTGFGLGTGMFNFAIQVGDPVSMVTAQRIFPFAITLGPLHVLETALPNANQNVAYRATLTPAGGIPPYRWSFDIANPQGLSINPNTGIITGTPPNAGEFGIPVTLRDSTTTVFSASLPLTVFPAVSITKTSLPNGSPGVPYSANLSAIGGALPYSWSVSSGNLPPGLSLNASTGQISGVPTAQGSFQFTIQVIDFGGNVATKVLTIGIGAGQTLTITTTSLPNATLNQPYSQTVMASGGVAPYTWSVLSGSLPAGLQVNTATGVISGTPTSVGTAGFDLKVTDAAQSTASKPFSIAVVNPANPVVVTSGDFSGSVLSPFSQTLTASGGTPPYTWSVSSGILPAGLQLNNSTGVLSGTPGGPGSSQVGFTATDANGQTGTKIITITIFLPPAPVTSVGVGSTSQPAVSLSLNAPYPLEITGFITLTFASSVGGTDDMIRFSDGSRSLQYIVRPNTTQAIFPTASNPAILTGTVAGTITMTVSMSAGGQNITPSPAPSKTITIETSVPSIISVALQQTGGGLTVVVTGYSNTREVSSGTFTFAASNGSAISPITVPLTSAYAAWFGNAASNATGGQFKLTMPFTVTLGSASAVTKVSISLTNAKGASAPVSSQ
jgi:Putative Ig domain